jgi:hypothetical protein
MAEPSERGDPIRELFGQLRTSGTDPRQETVGNGCPGSAELVWMWRFGVDAPGYSHIVGCERCWGFLHARWTEEPIPAPVLYRAADPNDPTARLLAELGVIPEVPTGLLARLRDEWSRGETWLRSLHERVVAGVATPMGSLVVPAPGFAPDTDADALEIGNEVFAWLRTDDGVVVEVRAPRQLAGGQVEVLVTGADQTVQVYGAPLHPRGAKAGAEITVDVPSPEAVDLVVIGPDLDL